MRNSFIMFSFLITVFTACNPFPGPRSVDWKKEWEKNETKLKSLAQDIIENGSKKYTTGINHFPSGFDYPFDDGFAISKNFNDAGTETDTINTKKITVTFYVDRGLLDHYSAIIFSNDTFAIHLFDMNVENGGNDFKIEPGWYMIND